MVVVHAARDPADLAREFAPSAQAIRDCVAKADRQEGRWDVKPAVTLAQEFESSAILVAVVIDFL